MSPNMLGNSNQRISKKVPNNSFPISQTHPCESQSPSKLYSLVFSYSPKPFTVSFFLISLSMLSQVFSSSSCFLSLKTPLHHLVFQYIFTSSVHIYIYQKALILIFLLFVSPLTWPVHHLFLHFFHFCIPAKSLISASIKQNAWNGLKFHPRWNRGVIVPVCMPIQDFPTETKQNP